MKAAIALAMLVAIPATAHAGQVHLQTVNVPRANVSQGAHMGSVKGGGGPPKTPEIHITKTTDKTSSDLYGHTAVGSHY